jgi:hypothetical protein
MDIGSTPLVVGNGRSGAFRDVVKGMVRGKEKGNDLAPAGEIGSGGGDLEVDVVGNANIADVESRRRGERLGGRWGRGSSAGDDGERSREFGSE